MQTRIYGERCTVSSVHVDGKLLNLLSSAILEFNACLVERTQAVLDLADESQVTISEFLGNKAIACQGRLIDVTK